nr:hypothetical protein K-LCC10_0166 [Kaumoebavirus]
MSAFVFNYKAFNLITISGKDHDQKTIERINEYNAHLCTTLMDYQLNSSCRAPYLRKESLEALNKLIIRGPTRYKHPVDITAINLLITVNTKLFNNAIRYVGQDERFFAAFLEHLTSNENMGLRTSKLVDQSNADSIMKRISNMLYEPLTYIKIPEMSIDNLSILADASYYLALEYLKTMHAKALEELKNTNKWRTSSWEDFVYAEEYYSYAAAVFKDHYQKGRVSLEKIDDLRLAFRKVMINVPHFLVEPLAAKFTAALQ